MATYADGKHATSTPLTPVSFVNAGHPFVYSNNPENVNSNTLSYIYGFQLLANDARDVEYYTNVRNFGAGRAGIAVSNQSGGPATITIKGSQQYIVRNGGVTVTAGKCADVMKSALEKSTWTMTIPNGTCRFLDDSTFVFTSADKEEKLCYGRYTLTSNKSGVYVRTFAGSSTTTEAQVFAKKPMTPCDGGGQFSGLLTYNQKNLSTPFSATVGTAFLIGEWFHNGTSALNNSNEYTGATHKAGSPDKLGGNYGVIYNLNFTNTSGKYLKLIPRTDAGQGCVLYSLNNGAWIKTTPLYGSQISGGSCWTVSFGSASTSNVRIIIPGSNTGNLKVEVCQ